ncbi:MAG: dTMP kinase [Brevinema sp.]
MCFITFEGVECSGKSLQSQRLLEYCQTHNIPAILVREPGGTTLGEELRTLILSQSCTPLAEFFMLSASRTQLTETIIKPALANNTLVISDRYFHSSLAYQGYGRNLDLDLLKVISQTAILGLQPNKTFLLNPSYQTIQTRLQQKVGLDRIEQESQVFHQKVYRGFLELAEQYHYISIIEGDQSPETIHQNIIKELSTIDPRFS